MLTDAKSASVLSEATRGHEILNPQTVSGHQVLSDPFQNSVDFVARRLLVIQQVLAIGMIAQPGTMQSESMSHFLYQGFSLGTSNDSILQSDGFSDMASSVKLFATGEDGGALGDAYRSVAKVEQLRNSSPFVDFCQSWLLEDVLQGLMVNGVASIDVELQDYQEELQNISAREFVRQVAIFPLEHPSQKGYYLFVFLRGELSPVFSRSIRLLIKTSSVFQIIQKGRYVERSYDSQSEAQPLLEGLGPAVLQNANLGTLKFFSEACFSSVVIVDGSQKVTFANESFCDVFGFSGASDVEGAQLNHFLFITSDQFDADCLQKPVVVSGCHVNGKALLLFVRGRKAIVDNSTYMMFFLEDKTSAAWEQEHRKIYQHQLSSIFDLALVGIFEVSSRDECVFSNAYLDRLLGRSLVGGHAGSWLEVFDAGDQQEIQLNLPVEVQHEGVYTRYCQIHVGTSTSLWIRFHACPNQALEGGFVGTITNETAQRRQEVQLRELAELDQLTGLVNRNVLNSRLQTAIEYVSRFGTFALMCLDLDGFKNINDSLGHDVGDALLVEVSQRLRKTARQVDIVARMGGDEFVILLANGMSETAAKRVANAVIAEVRKPFDIASRALYITVSIGIVVCNDTNQSAASLLKQGDMALYQAKTLGRNNVQFFTPELDNVARSKLDIITQLHEALSNQEFYVQYQPQLDLESGRLFGFEALLRWSPKSEVDVVTSEFIELLEGSGLIHDVSTWMIDTCLQDFSRWREKGWISQDQKLSLNISSLQLLLGGFAESLAKSCSHYNLRPSDLILELNETIFMDRVLKEQSALREIKDREFALAIDDFGTGYSSIHSLIRLDVDYLKINTNLMRDIFSDPKDLMVVDSILAIGDRLGIDVIAVGVDHPAKINYLRDLGCRVCQGFVCSKPMTAAHLERELFKSQPSNEG